MAVRPTRLVRSHFAVYHAATGTVALVDPGDGSRRLPWVDEWDEDLELLRPAGTDAAADAPASAKLGFDLPPLTQLTSWARARRTVGDHEQVDRLYLCEAALGHELAGRALGRWSPASAEPDELPPELARALATLPGLLSEAGVEQAVGPRQGPASRLRQPHWPVFNLPGFGAVLAEAVAGDSRAQQFARVPAASSHDQRDLRQVRGWCLSSVWLNDEVVLKVSHPAWGLEPLLTTWLGERLPDLVPEVLASGSLAGRGGASTPWFLQRRAAAADDREERGPAADERNRRASVATVEALARIQRAGLGSAAALAALGVEDRSPLRTAEELGAVWASQDMSLLSLEERERLPLLDDWLRTRLAELQARGAPLLLSHGDLHLGNVLRGAAGGLAIIDWTDAALAWPGVDLLTLLGFSGGSAPARDELIGEYARALGERQGLAEPDLLELTTLGLALAPAYHAVSYARIESFLGPALRWHFAGTIAQLVRGLLSELPVAA